MNKESFGIEKIESSFYWARKTFWLASELSNLKERITRSGDNDRKYSCKIRILQDEKKKV